ncbi:MAG: ABC transporter substrate-binding protein [Candidatus Hodarchaeota archaeon]
MKKGKLIFLTGFILLVLSSLGPIAPVFASIQAEGECEPLEELSFKCWVLDWDWISVDAGYAIAEAMNEIGIKMEVVELDDALFYDPIDEGGRLDGPGGSVVNKCRVFETYEMSWGFSPVPTHPYYRTHSSQDYPIGSCNTGMVNATLDESLEKSMTTINPTELKSVLNDVQKYMAETLPYYPLFISMDTHVIRKEWTGYIQIPGGIFTYFNKFSPILMTNGGDNEFVTAYWSDIDYFNPIEATDGRSSWFAQCMYDTLIAYNEDLEKIPWLAESWTQSADGKTVNFTIRQGVKWHDGEDFTPEDVAFCLDYYKNHTDGGYYANVERIDSITIDGQVVSIKLTTPFTWAIDEIGVVYQIPKHVWDGEDPMNVKWETNVTNKTLRVGTGPFRYVSGVREYNYILEKNPTYWFTGGTTMPYPGASALPTGSYPKIENLTVVVVEEEMDRAWGMQTNLYDSERYEASLSIVESVENGTLYNLKLVQTTGQWNYYFVWNQQVKPFDDLAVRQAMAYAMDIEAIGEYAMEDYAVPTYTVIPEAFYPAYYNPNVEKYEINVAKAKEILEEAGYKDTNDDDIREVPGYYKREAPGFEAPIVIVSILALVYAFSRRKRKK